MVSNQSSALWLPFPLRLETSRAPVAVARCALKQRRAQPAFDTPGTIEPMEPLGPPDAHFLSAAVGWFELGNLPEAKAELAKIALDLGRHPEVLEVRWLISAQEKNWDEGLAVAGALVEVAPQRSSGWLHRAYALRRARGGGLQAAWDALLPAFENFPAEATIPYNLSCYACQMGRLDEARQWLQRAVKIAGKDPIKFMAVNDDDLEPLWREIKKL